ncbi:SNF2 family N-terminal domain-containing protein [Xylariaceae sp. FL0594]|nr:SNF2 family N-terminal domain-containing protein [Xylariaceae sp. FL0594]
MTLDVRDDGMHHLTLILDINWNPADHALRTPKQRGLSEIVLNVLREKQTELPREGEIAPLKPEAFYKAAFMPNRDEFNDLHDVSIPGLLSTLYPFQRRALQWLLMREGVRYTNTDPDSEQLQLDLCAQPPRSQLPLSFRARSDVYGQPYYVSDLCHAVTRDVTPFQDSENAISGGILAEEMGLGKTVEMISLILTHRRDITPSGPHAPNVPDTAQRRATGATLIVTPDTLQNQWLSEFKKHAPQLLVLKYPGMKVWSRERRSSEEARGNENLSARFASRLATCDVVITTYSVLQTEIHYTRPPPERAMRYERRHERHTSPLVAIDWWRICLDEAQQIDSGVSNAAMVARSIPRVHAWAVTGTPVKDDPADLWGLLLFLNYEPFASSKSIWEALLNNHPALFEPLFARISLRHSKRAVRDELKLPAQSRYVVTMPFTSIERHHYRTQLKAYLERAGLREDGSPLHVNWDADRWSVAAELRGALANLRQTILHPELGSITDRVVIYRTLSEHLDAMIERSDNEIRAHERNYWATKTKRGQLLDNTPRVGDAIPVWEEVLKEMEPNMKRARNELQAALELAQKERTRREQERAGDDVDIGPEEADDEETLETAKVGECRRRLRSLLEVEHKVRFLIASALYQVKSNEDLTKPDSDEYRQLEQRETEGYELAQTLRKEILHDPLSKALRLLGKIRARAEDQSFVEIPEAITEDVRGIESRGVVDVLETLGHRLNEQANLIDEWRERVVQLMLKPLVDAEKAGDGTGEEYGDSTEVQDHLIVYTQALRAAIADRHDALSGLMNERVVHETGIAERLARSGQGHAPGLLLALLRQRRDMDPGAERESLRGSIATLRTLATKLRNQASGGSNRARMELDIVTRHLRATQDLMTKQTKAVLSLERELDFFTSAMNARIEFYRQLQAISDDLAPLGVDAGPVQEEMWRESLGKESLMMAEIDRLKANHRHLLHLEEEETSGKDLCAICGDCDETVWALTTCGHTFHGKCLLHWLARSHRCPHCRAYQTRDMLSPFQHHQATLKIVQGPLSGPDSSPSAEKSKRTGIYSTFSDAELGSIQNLKLQGPSYSTKIDTLVKHLQWLRMKDPGSKSIVFSQFRRFLDILHVALVHNRIGCARFMQGQRTYVEEIERFKENPAIECLLMDAKAHSSGLNFVNANHVFLCEPLLNTALELQAIARVDRIGQEHKTTVWLYLAEDTIEENIYALSERRRLAHMGEAASSENTELDAAAIEAANSHELEQGGVANLMDKTGEGEVVAKGDLWECFFGTMSR